MEEQEKACLWAEEGSIFGVRWRGPLHSPWGLKEREMSKGRKT